MKKISILIDITASNDLKVVEEILHHLKKDFNDDDDINVLFYPTTSNSKNSHKKFKDLIYPLVENIKKDKDNFFLFGGNIHETNVLKEELINQPDTLIMLSDFYDLPLSTEDILNELGEATKTNLLFICTTDSLEVVNSFTKAILCLPNIKTSTLAQLKIEEEKNLLDSKIKLLRVESNKSNKNIFKV